jgi:hypothetical protein
MISLLQEDSAFIAQVWSAHEHGLATLPHFD